jgi:DNA-binding CsgD family transcriptional regulator
MTTPEINGLSERELDILKLVATGASNKEIAQKLFISSNTVKVHLRNIFVKIGVTSRTEAAMYAVRNGMVETRSAQLLTIDDVSESDNNAVSQEETIAPNVNEQTSNKKQTWRYAGIFGGLIIALVILGFVYFRLKNNPTIPQILPTSTPRVQWTQHPGLPTPRKGLAVINFENQIYAIGGEDASGPSNVVEKYDPQTNVWSGLSSKPTSVTDINAAVIGGLIYVPGGKLASGQPTDINEYYDPRTNQWSSGGPLPKPLSSYALTVYEGRMYLFGGWDGNQIVNNAYVYDHRNNTWSEIPPMPTARSNAGAVAVGGKIYVIGGWDDENALNINEVYQPDMPENATQWAQSSPLPSGRYGMGITNLADIIFIIGGVGPDESLTVIALPPEGPNWGQLEAPVQSGWSFLSAVTLGTRLYALGGTTEQELINQMWSYQAIFTITLPIIR